LLVVGTLAGDRPSRWADWLAGRTATPRRSALEARYFTDLVRDYRDFFADPEAVFTPYVYSERFAYYTGARTVMLPRNSRTPFSRDRNFVAWLEKWRVDYFLVTDTTAGRFVGLTDRRYVLARRPGDMLLDARAILEDLRAAQAGSDSREDRR
jgi:hypothetical protein